MDAGAIHRRIDALRDRGVRAFALHAGAGAAADATRGFMSDAWLESIRVAAAHAATRRMWLVLHDGGMHDGQTAGGRVVHDNPRFARQALVRRIIGHDQRLDPAAEEQILADLPIDEAHRCVIALRPAGAQPGRTYGAADPLNPEAVAAFRRTVHDRYEAALSAHFGSTIRAILTDPPLPAAADLPEDARPGTAGILEHVNAYLGYDFTPHLPHLWDEAPQAIRFRADYERAVKHRLAETYYQPLREWCEARGLVLTGCPAEPDDLALQRCLHWPGQRITGRAIQPGERAIIGPPSTPAKVAASVKAHHRRARAGQMYPDGDDPEASEAFMAWLTNWLVVRGCDLLMPHTAPEPRAEPRFRTDPDAAGRLCWLNRMGTPAVKTAVLALSDYAPTRAARVLYENQLDFHYLEAADLAADAIIANDGLDLAGFWYSAVIVDGIAMPRAAREPLARLSGFGRVLAWQPPEGMPLPPNVIACHQPEELTAVLRKKGCGDMRAEPTPPGLRIRHLTLPVTDRAEHWFMLFNEQADPVDTLLDLPVKGRRFAVDPYRGTQQPLGDPVRCLLPAYQLGLLRVIPD